MITEEIIAKLKTQLSKKEEITSSDLSSLNLTSYDINKLINENYIKRISRGKYKYIKQEELSKKESTLNKKIQNPTSVLSALLKKDLDSAIKNLRDVLNNINKKEYEFLIIDYIKISILEKDLTYSKPMLTLTKIINNNYTYNINDFIEQFYIAISSNNSKLASLYLDIIKKLNILNNDEIIVEGLEEVLKYVEDSEKKEQIEEISPTIDEVEEHEVQEEESTEKQQEAVEKIVVDEEDDEVEEIPLPKHNEELDKLNRELITAKHDIIKKSGGIVILNPMSDERIEDLIHIIDEYNDMSCFMMKCTPHNSLVLKKRIPKDEKKELDMKKINKEMVSAYREKNYKEAIEKGLILIENVRTPYSNIYALVGLSFVNLKMLNKSIPYLKVATYISQKYEDTNLDFTDLIANIKRKQPKKDENYENKPFVRIDEKGFETNNYYLNNFIEINNYINKNNTSLETACNHFGLNGEEHDLLLLTYAKLFYAEQSYDYGDALLKLYEKSTNKTTQTMKIWQEIQRRKKFFLNEKNEDLILSLKLI